VKLKVITCNVYAIDSMTEFENHVAALPAERAFSPVRNQNHSSSASSQRSGGARHDDFFSDQDICPTCRGAGHISHGLIL